jgi:hypothetical protein
MPSHYIYIPVLILCAPLILSVVALIMITTFFALIVISIRLGFLAIEFSCGLVLDFIRFSINSLLGENPYNKHVKKNEIKDKSHYKTNSNKSCISMIANNKRPYRKRSRSDYI